MPKNQTAVIRFFRRFPLLPAFDCDMLILDEVLGIVDEKVISPEEICELFAAKPEEMTLVCTGRVLDEKIREAADEVYNIAPEK